MTKSDRGKLRAVLLRLGAPLDAMSRWDGHEVYNARGVYKALSPDEAFAINAAAQLLDELESRKARAR
jgi:hypothetical protein